MDSIREWAQQFARESEVIGQGGMQNEPYMGNIASQPQQEVGPSFFQSHEELRNLLFEENENDFGFPELNVEPSNVVEEPYIYNSTPLHVIDVDPLSVAVVPFEHNNTDEEEQKQHGFKYTLDEKLKNVIECALRAIGLVEYQIPVIVDLTPAEEVAPCRYSSKTTENDIETILSTIGRDKIAFLPEEGKSRLSLLERISGWSVRQSPRQNNISRDSYFTYTNNLLRKTFRSTIEVLHFIFYEKSRKEMMKGKVEEHVPSILSRKEMIKRKIEEDIPSTSEKRLFRGPPETLEEIYQGYKLYNLAETTESEDI